MTTEKNRKANSMAGSFMADENILSLYLKEINRIPLLTKDEEDTTARAAAKGDKKTVGDTISLVLLKGIGKPVVHKTKPSDIKL